jgi:hypothetical protein
MATDNDVLKDAIIGTEKEIFGDAFGKEDLTLDTTGDRSLEAMGEGLEGQVEPEEDEEGEGEATETEAKPATEAEAKPEVEAKPAATEEKPETQGRVPAGRLREEAERARAALAERDAIKAQFDEAQKAIADRDAMLAQLAKALPQQPKPEAPAAPKTPDLFEDPVAFAEHINKGVQERLDAYARQVRDQQVNASLEAARARHGQTYEEAFATLKSLDFKNPDNVALVKRMEASPNPGETVVAWHKRNLALREVGDDIGSYRARVAEETRKQLAADPEFRKELLASLRGEAMTGDQGRIRSEVRLPKSLSQTAGNGARTNDTEIFDGSDRSTFDSAWSS